VTVKIEKDNHLKKADNLLKKADNLLAHIYNQAITLMLYVDSDQKTKER